MKKTIQNLKTEFSKEIGILKRAPTEIKMKLEKSINNPTRKNFPFFWLALLKTGLQNDLSKYTKR